MSWRMCALVGFMSLSAVLLLGVLVPRLMPSTAADSSNWADVTLGFAWGSYQNRQGTHAAHVFAEPAGDDLCVRLHVYIGRGSKNYLDVGELGRAETYEAALASWGKIGWRSDGIFVGSEEGKGRFFTWEEMYKKKLCDSGDIRYRIK